MKINLAKSMVGGVIGTAVLTMMMYFVAPMMLGHPMDIAAMLGSLMGNSWALGMAAHVMNGVVIFPLLYALLVYKRLPGAPWARGIIWGIALWLIAEAVVMPMMGAGFFSSAAGGMTAVVAAFVGHILYGGSLGAVAGAGEVR